MFKSRCSLSAGNPTPSRRLDDPAAGGTGAGWGQDEFLYKLVLFRGTWMRLADRLAAYTSPSFEMFSVRWLLNSFGMRPFGT